MTVRRHQVLQVELDTINDNNWNPNFVNTHTMKAIDNNIEENGFLEAVILQKHNDELNKDNVIINGEHRCKIMREKGEKTVDAIVIDVNDERAKALSIRLNREHGELFPDATSALLKSLSPELNFPKLKELTWLPDSELKAFAGIETEGEATEKTTKTKKVKEATCPNCKTTFPLT